MAVLKYKKGQNGILSPHFTMSEFDCPCTNCTDTEVDTALIDKLELFRNGVGIPVKINSGYRCANYQNDLRLRGYETAIGVSQHELGRAADVMREDAQSSGIELEAIARSCGFKAVGVGHNWIHVDLRDDKERRWEYTKK